MELLNDNYQSPIAKDLRWSNWATDEEGITGDELLEFINNNLLPSIKELKNTGNPIINLIKNAFEDATNYMKNGTLLRQVINKVNEIDFNSSDDRHLFGDIYEKLAAACPDGVDIYFENVGGPVSKAVSKLLNEGSRVPICGFISAYNSEDMSKEETPFHIFGAVDPVPEHRFFVVTEWFKEWREATNELSQWISECKIKNEETITEGFENAPQGLRDVLNGKNFGKQLIKVAEE